MVDLAKIAAAMARCVIGAGNLDGAAAAFAICDAVYEALPSGEREVFWSALTTNYTAGQMLAVLRDSRGAVIERRRSLDEMVCQATKAAYEFGIASAAAGSESAPDLVPYRERAVATELRLRAEVGIAQVKAERVGCFADTMHRDGLALHRECRAELVVPPPVPALIGIDPAKTGADRAVYVGYICDDCCAAMADHEQRCGVCGWERPNAP